MSTFYKVLGVTPDSDPDVIDAAYRALIKKYHPDKRPHGRDRSAELNEAYATLRDPRKRAAYDEDLRRSQGDQLPSADREASADGRRSSSSGPQGGKRCPDCAETVNEDARVCRFCGYEFRSTDEREPPTQPGTPPLPWLKILAVVAGLLFVLWALGLCSYMPSTSDYVNQQARQNDVDQPVTPTSVTSHNVHRPANPAPTASDASAASTAPANPAVLDMNETHVDGRCRLVAADTTYIDGACHISLDHDGSFTITSEDGQYFAMLFRDGPAAIGYWNGGAGSTHAQDPLGAMTRHGACWRSEKGEICAWANK